MRVAGDGPLRREVEAEEHVQYEGWLRGEELGSFVDSCDIGLVPSLCNDVGPFVVPEWLSAGRPLLATRRGSLIEAERRGGVMTFDESPAALVGAVRSLGDAQRWSKLVASMPAVDGDTHVERWLDDHEAAYAAAVGATRQRVT